MTITGCNTVPVVTIGRNGKYTETFGTCHQRFSWSAFRLTGDQGTSIDDVTDRLGLSKRSHSLAAGVSLERAT